MTRLIRSHFKTLTPTLPLAGRGRKFPLLSEERARVRSRGQPAGGSFEPCFSNHPFTVSRRVWHISMAVLVCLIVVPSVAHAHGGMSGQEIAPPIVTSGVLGFVCYWLVMLWPSAKKKGTTAVGPSTPSRQVTRTRRHSHKHSARVKHVPRLRKIERSGQVGSNVNSGRRATDV